SAARAGAPLSRPAPISNATAAYCVPGLILFTALMAGSVALEVAQSRRTVRAGQLRAPPGAESGGMLDREVGERGQPRLIRGVGQLTQIRECLLHLFACQSGRIVEAAGGFDGHDDRFELFEAAFLDRAADG